MFMLLPYLVDALSSRNLRPRLAEGNILTLTDDDPVQPVASITLAPGLRGHDGGGKVSRL